MILFKEWKLETDGQAIAQQFDHLTRTLVVEGEFPEDWEWTMLVKIGDAMDILPLTPTQEGLGIVLTAKQLSLFGYYTMQLRAMRGELVRHTNSIQVYVPASLTGDERWPDVPSEFTGLECRATEAVQKAEKAAEKAENGAGQAGEAEKNAREAETAAQNAANSAGQSAVNASESERAAAEHKSGAEQAALRAESYTSHPPVVGENGNWWCWDDTQYTDSGKPSRGELTVRQGNALYANALKGTASGATIRLNDASPLEHSMEVRVSGVDDLTAVTVYSGGVNLYDDGAKTVGANIDNMGKETADAATNLSDYFVVPPNTTIRISLANRWAFYDAEKNVLSWVTNSATIPRTVVVPSNACYMRFSYHTAMAGGNTANISDGSDIMAVVGELPAAYCPFTQGLSAYPISGDGSCEVTSIAPTMTLLTDNPNAVMECEYNRDINKAYDQLVQAIISMGGNI